MDILEPKTIRATALPESKEENPSTVTPNMSDKSLESGSREDLKHLQAQGYQLPTWRLTIVIGRPVQLSMVFQHKFTKFAVSASDYICPSWTLRLPHRLCTPSQTTSRTSDNQIGCFLAIVVLMLVSLHIEISWINVSPQWPSGCAIIFTRISEVFGRKASVLALFTLFVGFSLGCAWSHNLGQLIVFRCLQGAGGCGLYTMCMVILPEISPAKLLPAISGIIGAVVAVAGMSGPIFGGLLTTDSTWRWCFW